MVPTERTYKELWATVCAPKLMNVPLPGDHRAITNPQAYQPQLEAMSDRKCARRRPTLLTRTREILDCKTEKNSLPDMLSDVL